MPLQREIYKISGKYNGSSYYYSKNGGYQFRSINPNMSELVKTDPRFEFTRKYAEVFKKAAQMSGTLISAVDERWRFMFRKNIQAKLTKEYNDYLRGRYGLKFEPAVLPGSEPSRYMEAFNGLCKNHTPSFISSWSNNQVSYSKTGNRYTISQGLSISRDLVQEYYSKGANVLWVGLYCLVNELQSDGTYRATMSNYSILEGEFNYDDFDPDTQQYTLLPASTPAPNITIPSGTEDLAGLIVVFHPGKAIDTNYYVLQRLCCAYWFHPKTY